MSQDVTSIGIDLGCTNIKGILITDQGRILHEVREETHEQDTERWTKAVVRIINDLFKESNNSARSFGLCAPGLADERNTSINCMPGRLPGLENLNWSQVANRRIAVLNDAHAALIAEAAFGSAKGMKHVVMLTLGSGVGGGILVNGELYQGNFQMAGHLGHTTVEVHAHERDVTNMPGSIEDAIGNITIGQRSYGKYPSTFALIEAYRKGDAFASWLWLDSVRKLSVSIASFINILSPEVIVLGGGIIHAGDDLLQPLKDFLDLYEWRPTGKRTEIRVAEFSDLAGALGAAAFALQQSKTLS